MKRLPSLKDCVQKRNGNAPDLPAATTESARHGKAERAVAAEPKKRTRKLEPFQPFPVATLPEPLAEYVRQVATAIGCDPAYVALPSLAVIASAIGNTRTILLKRTWKEVSVLWTAIVGDSGTLKSPAWEQPIDHLHRLQRKFLQDHRVKAAIYADEVAEYRAAKKGARDGGPDPGAPPEKPLQRRLVCSDTTIEKLVEILEDNPRGLLLADDELSRWFGSFCRYKGKGGGTDMPHWLSMQRAGPVMYDRKTGDRPTIHIPHAAVSITGGIQPAVLSRVLTTEFQEAGLAARFLVAMPTRRPKRWTELELDPDVDSDYRKLIDGLLNLQFDLSEQANTPYALRLAPTARTAWIEFYDSWAEGQAVVHGPLAAAFSKLEAYAARFALLDHVVTHVGRNECDLGPIEQRSIEAGIALCRWFGTEATRLYAMLAESEEDREARRLFEFIQGRGGSITVRGLMRANNRRWPSAVAAQATLGDLVDSGLAKWTEGYRSIELCMTHDTHDIAPEEGGDDETIAAGVRDDAKNGTAA
jgi:hypothetical protein